MRVEGEIIGVELLGAFSVVSVVKQYCPKDSLLSVDIGR